MHNARPPGPPHETHKPRGSTVTQTSGATLSSALYPLSTHDGTGTETPSTPSTRTYSPVIEVDETESDDDNSNNPILDPEDMSYRLKLLIRNNYYLPPAHAKPTHVDTRLAQETASPKIAGPAIRNLFRIGGPKRANMKRPQATSTHVSNRPPRLDTLIDHLPPLASAVVQQRRSSGAEILNENERKGRVVVIRERLGDMQGPRLPSAEGAARAINLLPMKHVLIDPTDTIDLPSYAFLPQGTGEYSSSRVIEASTMADFLPCGHGSRPGHSSTDEAWRRALLTEAVDLSLSSIHLTSSESPQKKSTSTLESSRVENPLQTLGQPILPRRSSEPGTNSVAVAHVPPQARSNPSSEPRQNHYHVPLDLSSHPLPPPPRSKFRHVNPPASSDKHIRKTASTPILPQLSTSLEPPSSPTDVRVSLLSPSMTNGSFSSVSHYSDEEPDIPPVSRYSSQSVDDSVMFSNRPSMSVSQRSHDSSVFGRHSNPYVQQSEAHDSSGSDKTNISLIQPPRTRTPVALNLTLQPPTSQTTLPETSEPTERSLTDETEERMKPSAMRPRAASTSSDVLTPRQLMVFPHDDLSASITSSNPPEHGAPFMHPTQSNDSLDRSKPITNTPITSSPGLFSSFMLTSKRSPRMPESTFELVRNTQESRVDLSVQSDVDENAHAPVSNSGIERDEKGNRTLSGLLKLHIEEERDRLRKIADNIRHQS